jgi:hypothetical protein
MGPLPPHSSTPSSIQTWTRQRKFEVWRLWKWVAFTWGFYHQSFVISSLLEVSKFMLILVRGLCSRTHVLEKQPTSCSAHIFPSKEGIIKEVLSLGSY